MNGELIFPTGEDLTSFKRCHPSQLMLKLEKSEVYGRTERGNEEK